MVNVAKRRRERKQEVERERGEREIRGALIVLVVFYVEVVVQELDVFG